MDSSLHTKDIEDSFQNGRANVVHAGESREASTEISAVYVESLHF